MALWDQLFEYKWQERHSHEPFYNHEVAGLGAGEFTLEQLEQLHWWVMPVVGDNMSILEIVVVGPASVLLCAHECVLRRTYRLCCSVRTVVRF